MIKSTIIGLISLLSVSEITAQNANSLLWEISGNGLEKPSYIYGTIHLIAQSDFVVRPEIDSVFNASQQVVFEMKLDDPTMLATFQKWMYLPEGKTLQDYCSQKEYSILKNYLSDSLQTDIATMITQKPFAISQLLVTGSIKEETASYELYFMQKTLEQGKTLSGLENLQDELEIFDSIPYDAQIDMLIQTITDENMEIVWSDLVRAYKAENLDSLQTYFYKSSPEFLFYEDLFLTNRNQKWIAEIEKLISKKTTFIAIGAAHLPGENGVLKLLEKKGYTINAL